MITLELAMRGIDRVGHHSTFLALELIDGDSDRDDFFLVRKIKRNGSAKNKLHVLIDTVTFFC